MVMENFLGVLVRNILEIIKMILKVVLEFMFGILNYFNVILASGKMEK